MANIARSEKDNELLRLFQIYGSFGDDMSSREKRDLRQAVYGLLDLTIDTTERNEPDA